MTYSKDSTTQAEPVAWQRRLRNTTAADDHPWSQWGSWKECSEEQVAYVRATGGVYGFPELQAEVRPLYAHPNTSGEVKTGEVLTEARAALDYAARHISGEKVDGRTLSSVHLAIQSIDLALSPTSGGGTGEDPELIGRRALAGLDEMAETWAGPAGITDMVAAICQQDDRESRLESLIKLAWVEGAYTGRTSHSTVSAAPSSPEDIGGLE